MITFSMSNNGIGSIWEHIFSSKYAFMHEKQSTDIANNKYLNILRNLLSESVNNEKFTIRNIKFTQWNHKKRI